MIVQFVVDVKVFADMKISWKMSSRILKFILELYKVAIFIPKAPLVHFPTDFGYAFFHL